ncbi:MULTISPECIES: GxxExxY protein [Chryseobacterium]|jgi:GxxExxY protein|uniref:GxxExxY protein n=1 Tax=Chryseobacterium gambrini TaxID=373672 RepID=A0ABM8KAY9_9FLAO|nr:MULTISPECIES: GxxExxY protein [Chryseobacterium]PVV61246.1 GxxExxY protein [Chryseobacterium sp. HMWF035]WBX96314.1 GxxExxY protein [Chryseobacterium gambrini]BEV06212.1 GxxExxY protein [Chryseobacterium gambrini]
MVTQKFINDLSYKIVGACIEVHKQAGPGLYEDVYHQCLEREFEILGLKYKSELEIPFSYKGKLIDCKLKCDFLIENLVVLEIKSVSEIHQIHKAQTMNYMNLLKVPRSILVNFNVINLYYEGYESFASKIFKTLPIE